MTNRTALGAAAEGLCLPDLESLRRMKNEAPLLAAPAPAITLPADHYAHPGAPTEWWWNIGTLEAGERTFGFEINAVSYAGQGGFGFTQVMVTDVSNQRHLQSSVFYTPPAFDAATWAESDPDKDWSVALGNPAEPDGTYVTMNAAAGDPTQNMRVKARMIDEGPEKTAVTFDLTLSQQGAPFLVLGSGVIPVPGTSGSPLETNNFYYSLTRLQASGTITIGDERFEVGGVTWMDHEWGAFASAGKSVKWILQDMQLDNGVSISNFSLKEPEAGQPTQSIATVQYPDGLTVWVPTTTVPSKEWTSPVTGKTYFMELQVTMHRYLIPWWPEALLTVTSIVDSQEFPVPNGAVYEGVARASGTFNGQQVSGPAWNEQTAR